MGRLTKDSPHVLKRLRRFATKKSLPDIDALGACFNLGLMCKSGEDDDGDPIWSHTEAGRRALEQEANDAGSEAGESVKPAIPLGQCPKHPQRSARQ